MKMNNSPGIPGRKRVFANSFATSAEGQQGEAPAPAPQGKRPPGGKRGASSEAGARGSGSDSDLAAPKPRTASNASNNGGSRAAASKPETRPRSISPNGDRQRIVGDDVDQYAHMLNVIRRNTKDSGRPLIKACLLLNDFAKKKTGNTNENCDAMLAAILEALADGRKVDGKDTTTHLDSLAEKLQAKHGDAFSNERIAEFRAALAEAIKSASRDQLFLAPWVRDAEAADPSKPFTKEMRKKIEKRAYFSAEELADKLIGGITPSHASNFFMVSRKVKNMTHISGAIRAARDKLGAEKPIFVALCNYLLSHEGPEITEANANVILSAMTKPYFRRGTNADTGKMESSFVIPTTAPFMEGAGNVTWQKKDKEGKAVGEVLRFAKEGSGNATHVVVLLQDRRHLLDLIFPKDQNERPANPKHAVIGMLGEMVSQDEKKEE